jgi:cardiolipin synthase
MHRRSTLPVLGDLPILGGNTVDILSDYDAIGPVAPTRRCALARPFFYIIADDAVAERVFAAMRRAVGRGVVCRVMADALGCAGWAMTADDCTPPASKPARRCLAFWLARRADLRNHRKIAIDGHRARDR